MFSQIKKVHCLFKIRKNKKLKLHFSFEKKKTFTKIKKRAKKKKTKRKRKREVHTYTYTHINRGMKTNTSKGSLTKQQQQKQEQQEQPSKSPSSQKKEGDEKNTKAKQPKEEGPDTLEFLGDVSSPKLDSLAVVFSDDGYRGWDFRDEYDLDKLRAAKIPGYKMGDFIFTYTFLGNTSSNLAKRASVQQPISTAVSKEPTKAMFGKRVIPPDFKQSFDVHKSNSTHTHTHTHTIIFSSFFK